MNRTRPEVVREIHQSYLEAGAEVIETNTFGALRHVLAEYGLEEEAEELAFLGARIAREAADPYGAFVAGALARAPSWSPWARSPGTSSTGPTRRRPGGF